jgi:hypothetical protein
LDLAVEDSYALSEIVSRIRQTNPGLSAAEAKRVARATVEEMVKQGYLNVCKLDEPNGVETVLDPIAAIVAVADDLAWPEADRWRPHIRISATDAGKEEYYHRR